MWLVYYFAFLMIVTGIVGALWGEQLEAEAEDDRRVREAVRLLGRSR